VRFGSFVVDSDRRQLSHDISGEVHLTPKAFDLLVVMIRESPRVVRKAELHERLWPDTFVSDDALVSLVKELRRALADRETMAPLIRTVHGVGYTFAPPLQTLAADRPSNTSYWIVAGARRIPLVDGENLIGRDPLSTIFLDSTGVSRRHARIVVGPYEARLEDLGSKNGTTVDDQPVTDTVRLGDGDRIAVGPIVIVFRATSSGMSTETVRHTVGRR
jgi:DNA-binding winged helix-turn-helix (wHTH) protein